MNNQSNTTGSSEMQTNNSEEQNKINDEEEIYSDEVEKKVREIADKLSGLIGSAFPPLDVDKINKDKNNEDKI